jgi:hypothetical protein
MKRSLIEIKEGDVVCGLIERGRDAIFMKNFGQNP